MKKLITIFGILILMSSCDDNQYPWTVKHKIEYKITTTSTHYIILYVNDIGNTVTASGNGNWTYDFKGVQDQYLMVNATNKDSLKPLMTAEITEGSSTISKNANNLIVDVSGVIK